MQLLFRTYKKAKCDILCHFYLIIDTFMRDMAHFAINHTFLGQKHYSKKECLPVLIKCYTSLWFSQLSSW